jgi:hypothetical protein
MAVIAISRGTYSGGKAVVEEGSRFHDKKTGQAES